MEGNDGGANRKNTFKEEYMAHVVYETGRKQSFEDHRDNVAEFAGKICPLSELKNISYIQNFLHDAGKLSPEIQNDFEKILKYGDAVHRHDLDHSTAGGRIAGELKKGSTVAELISMMIYSHHGLQDCIDLKTGQTLEEKRSEKNIDYEVIKQRFFQISDENVLKEKFENACSEFTDIKKKIDGFLLGDNTKGNSYFYIGMYARLLLSVLIDSDWTDTACFFQNVPLPERLSIEKTQAIWEKSRDYFEDYLREQVQKDPGNGSLLNAYRQEISDLCMTAAKEEQSLYRLTVPTGAGKTLSSLRFALHHAIEKQKQHIIYVAPFNSILEQNAKEIRMAVGNPEIVLEHHCNVVCEDEKEEKKYRELTETWDSPIIVTTAVQILNTLFLGQKSCIRRMHTLCNSIIIFDEVQAIPFKCTELFHLAVNFLTAFCNTTVILCSATQPSLAPAKKNAVGKCVEMAGAFEKYAEAFKRTEIVDMTRLCPGGMEISNLKDFVLEKIGIYKSVLVIVNTTTCARELFQVLKTEYNGSECQFFHLSNNMCAEHKLDKLKEIREKLKKGERVVCVSTSVVEAGVNFSFGCVVRSKAGLDNVIQAAGRCNRHKELGDMGVVYIVQMSKEAENLSRLKEIRMAQSALQKVLDDFGNNPEKFKYSLDSQEAIREYYKNLFFQLGKKGTEFQLKDSQMTLVELLGKNETGRKQYERSHDRRRLKSPFAQAFQTAGREFEVISDECKVNIIVPYDEKAKASIRRLEDNYIKADEKRRELRKLQRYTVGISAARRDKLNNSVRLICQNEILVLSEDYYDSDIGVSKEPKMKNLIM